MNVGKSIKSYLNENGIKQSWLAEKIGSSNSALSMQLSSKNMKVSTLFAICEALNVKPDIFLNSSSKKLGN